MLFKIAPLTIDLYSSLVFFCLLLVLFSKTIRQSDFWNATVTPLASIIGSGFLIVAPLIWMLSGYASIWVLMLVLVIAYGIGSMIRYNIQYAGSYAQNDEVRGAGKILNDLSYLTLGISYFISVTFYVRILSAFVLKLFYIDDPFLSNLLTSLIISFIGIVGYCRGFDRLEFLELYSVNIKISIIAMLLCGLFLYDWKILHFTYQSTAQEMSFTFESFRKICGILLIVQGFEISRYLGNKYSAELRVSTMKAAQLISSIIYLVFVFLILFIMETDQKVTETSIIDLTRTVSPFLPIALTVGAIFSQFSAAIADTVGCGGIIAEYSQNRISHEKSYLIISVGCLLLVWFVNVFEIISLASRLFAAYYFTQCVQVIYINKTNQWKAVDGVKRLCGVDVTKIKRGAWSVYAFCMAGLMLVVFIFGIPAE